MICYFLLSCKISALYHDYNCIKNPLSLKSILGGCWRFLTGYLENGVILDINIKRRSTGTRSFLVNLSMKALENSQLIFDLARNDKSLHKEIFLKEKIGGGLYLWSRHPKCHSFGFTVGVVVPWFFRDVNFIWWCSAHRLLSWRGWKTKVSAPVIILLVLMDLDWSNTTSHAWKLPWTVGGPQALDGTGWSLTGQQSPPIPICPSMCSWAHWEWVLRGPATWQVGFYSHIVLSKIPISSSGGGMNLNLWDFGWLSTPWKSQGLEFDSVGVEYENPIVTIVPEIAMGLGLIMWGLSRENYLITIVQDQTGDAVTSLGNLIYQRGEPAIIKPR